MALVAASSQSRISSEFQRSLPLIIPEEAVDGGMLGGAIVGMVLEHEVETRIRQVLRCPLDHSRGAAFDMTRQYEVTYDDVRHRPYREEVARDDIPIIVNSRQFFTTLVRPVLEVRQLHIRHPRQQVERIGSHVQVGIPDDRTRIAAVGEADEDIENICQMLIRIATDQIEIPRAFLPFHDRIDKALIHRISSISRRHTPVRDVPVLAEHTRERTAGEEDSVRWDQLRFLAEMEEFARVEA